MAPSVDDVIPRWLWASAGSLDPAIRLHIVFLNVTLDHEWAANLNPSFRELENCEQAVKSDHNLACCLEECTGTGNWDPLFTLLQEKYPRPQTLPQPQITIEDVVQQARGFLNSTQSRLRQCAQQTHPDIDGSNPIEIGLSIFMDGVGNLYDTDREVHDRVDRLFVANEGYEPRLLFNTSGSGKTRLIIEGLCQQWGFYFTAKDDRTLESALGSNDVKDSWSLVSRSPGFSLHISNNPRDDLESQRIQNVGIVRRIFHALLLSRALVLERFLLLGQDQPPHTLRRRWTHLQLVPFNPLKSDIFAAVLARVLECLDAQAISRETDQLLVRLSQRLPNPLWIVLDEAQIASETFVGSFYTEQDKKASEEDHGRSVLREMIANFTNLRIPTRIIIAGTGLSLDSVIRDGGSVIGKTQRDFVVWSDTGGFDTKESQSLYILQKTRENLSQDVLDRGWHWLRGRYRFTVNFVGLLLQFGVERANSLLSGLVTQLTDGYEPTDVPSVPLTLPEGSAIRRIGKINLSRLQKKQGLEEELARAALEFVTRGGMYLTSSQNADAVQIGFARLAPQQEMNNQSLWTLGTVLADQKYLEVVLNEPLAIAAALQYFERHHSLSIDQQIERRLRQNSHPSTRGLVMETVTMMALTRAFDGSKSLSEIFKVQGTEIPGFLRKPASLQAITGRGKRGKFQTIPAQFQRGSIPVLGLQVSEPEGVTKWLYGSETIFLFPPNQMGPDLVFLAKAGGQLVWIFVQVRSRVKKFATQERLRAVKTVNPQFFWIDKNGNEFSPKSRPGLPAQILKDMHISKSGIPVMMVLVSHPSGVDNSTLDHLADGLDAITFVATFDVGKDPKFSEVLGQIKELVVE